MASYLHNDLHSLLPGCIRFSRKPCLLGESLVVISTAADEETGKAWAKQSAQDSLEGQLWDRNKNAGLLLPGSAIPPLPQALK